MGRYERRIYFDRLVDLREEYRQLGSDDTTAVLSIDETVDWATELLGAGAAESEVDSGWG